MQPVFQRSPMGGARVLDLDRKPDEVVSGQSLVEVERQQRNPFTPIELKGESPTDSLRSNSVATITPPNDP